MKYLALVLLLAVASAQTHISVGKLDVSGAATFGSTVVGNTIEGIFYVDQQPGGSVAAQILAAQNLCAAYSNTTANGCVIVASPGLACGEGANQFADNVLFVDYRICAQSQGLRFNLSTAATGNVRSKMFLQDNFTWCGSPCVVPSGKNVATFYVASYPDLPNTAAANSNMEAINGTQTINSLSGNYLGSMISAEFDTLVTQANGAPYTVDRMFGLTSGVGLAGNTGVATRAVSVYATAGVNTTSNTIAEWDGFYVAPMVPNSGNITKSCELAAAGSTSGESCINAPATGGAANTLPSTPGTLTVTVGTGTATSAGTIINAGTSQTLAVTVTGATTTDVATCSTATAYPATWQTGIAVMPPVLSSNTVTLTFSNGTAGNITPAAQAFRCTVFR